MKLSQHSKHMAAYNSENVFGKGNLLAVSLRVAASARCSSKVETSYHSNNTHC